MKRLQVICVVCISFLLVSCFEVIEDITINKNGSGHLKVILNASQSRSDINALLLLKEVNGHPIPSLSAIKSKIVSFKDSVQQMAGFSNVKTQFDDKNFILVFEADFDKVERLNSGIYRLWNKYDRTSSKREVYFKYVNQVFTRKPGQLFNAIYLKMQSADRKVLQNATYTALYRFEQLVKAQKNSMAKISPNKKVVFLKLPLQLMIEKPSYWYNIITLN